MSSRHLLLPVLALLALAPLGARGEGRVLTVSRLTCFAGCPSYQVTVSEEGRLELQGRENVAWVGTYKEQAGAAAVAPIFAAVDAAGFAGFRASYGIGTCKPADPKDGIAVVNLKTGPTEKSVRFQSGCPTASPSQAGLERILDTVTRVVLTPKRLIALRTRALAKEPPRVASSTAGEAATGTEGGGAEAATPMPAGSKPATPPAPKAEPEATQAPSAPPAGAPTATAAGSAKPTAAGSEAPKPAPEPGKTEAATVAPAGQAGQSGKAGKTAPEAGPTAAKEPSASEKPKEATKEAGKAATAQKAAPATKPEETAKAVKPAAAPKPKPRAAAVAPAAKPKARRVARAHPSAAQAPSKPRGRKKAPAKGPDRKEPARELLKRFQAAYNTCDVDRMRKVVSLDTFTANFFTKQCGRCGGFDVDVELRDVKPTEDGTDVYFEQRVRCRRSKTLSVFELIAEVGPVEPWHINRIVKAP